MTKDKVKQLNKSIAIYTDALNQLHHIEPSKQRYRRFRTWNLQTGTIKHTNIPNKQIKRWIQR